MQVTTTSHHPLQHQLSALANEIEQRLKTLNLTNATIKSGQNDREERNFTTLGHFLPAELCNTWIEIQYPEYTVSLIRKVWTEQNGKKTTQFKGYISDFSDFELQHAVSCAFSQMPRTFGILEIPSLYNGSLSFDLPTNIAKSVFKGVLKISAASGTALSLQ